MMGLRKIQIRRESTRGTPVTTAMDLLNGRLTMTPNLSLYMPEDEDRNSLALLHRRTITGQQAALRYDGSVNFEQIINFLAMALEGATDDSGTGVIGTPTAGILTRDWTFEPTLTASAVQNAFTVQYGDNQQAYQSSYVMASQLEFTYAMGEPLVVSADLFGQFPTKVSFGGTPTEVTVEDAVSQKTKLCIDTTWAGLGTTQISDTLISAVVRIPTGLAPVRYADGGLEFSSHSENKWTSEWELVYKHNTSGEDEYDDWVDGTQRFIRLETTGSEIEQVSPTYDKLFRLDGSVFYTDAPELLSEQDGENVFRLSGRTFHDPTADRQLLALVRNTQTALA